MHARVEHMVLVLNRHNTDAAGVELQLQFAPNSHTVHVLLCTVCTAHNLARLSIGHLKLTNSTAKPQTTPKVLDPGGPNKFLDM